MAKLLTAETAQVFCTRETTAARADFLVELRGFELRYSGNALGQPHQVDGEGAFLGGAWRPGFEGDDAERRLTAARLEVLDSDRERG
jgi:hypothetical protein